MSGRHSFRAFEQADEEREDEEREAKSADDVTDEAATDADTSVEDVNTDAETETPAEREETADAEETEAPEEPQEPEDPGRRTNWSRVAVVVVLPALALLLAAGSAFLKWQIGWERGSAAAATESVEAAKDITTQMLSYEPATVEQQLNSVRERLTGEFLDTYTEMINTAIIPGATAQNITAVADVPSAGSVSASPHRAEVLLYLNQSVMVGDQAPQKTPSTVRATMVHEDGRWLMSQFEPVKP
ncbi:hypothetical protein [Mycolicibacterium sp. XJ870]